MYMTPVDAWLIGIVWDDADGVQWMDKDEFEQTFES
jgi:hypothetical protein